MRRTRGAVAIIIGVVGGCFPDVGSVPGPGGGGDDGGGPPDANPTVAVCRDEVLNTADGNHNDGQDCLQAGCHALGGEGPRYIVAGTLYTTPGGGTPNVGATITIRDSAGVVLDLRTMQNGNFYTAQPLAMPVTTFASKCPTVISMVASAAGNCNTGGCHDGVSATGRISLP